MLIAGVLLTLSAEYAIGIVLGAINYVTQHPWQISGRADRIARRRPGWWWYTRPGIIFGGVINALLWPALLWQIIKEA